jgi:hypothetical protein
MMNMKRYWIWKGLKIALLAALAVLAFGFIVMSLWNWLMPPLFGWTAIDFWQALGLVVLSRILFGGWRGGHGGRMHWRGRMAERWAQMTPEEREKFREGMRGRCGHREEPPAASQA